jgi:N-acylneuraminate cytidylyltransferase/CMP-N,N'-diacetyllegionaminic acid synthase
MLAIIPARGGSKGIPRKNLALLGGKPLIQHTIEAAQQSQSVSRIVLTTDDAEIAALGTSLGLDTRYQRPPKLAQDDTPMAATLTHCLQWVHQAYGACDEFMLLQPTSPLRTATDIDAAVCLYRENHKNSLLSVNAMSEHPYECVELKAEGWAYLAKNASGASRRQDYNNVYYYYINGAIYITRVESFLRSGKMMDEDSVCFYPMARERSVDIDETFDLLLAQALLPQSRP